MTLWQQLKAEDASLRQSGLVTDQFLDTVKAYARHKECSPDEAILLLLRQALDVHQQADHDHLSWEKLSAREKQIAAWMCSGLTNRQIAAHLVISPETVKTHVRHLLRKFNLRSRRELRARLKDWDLSEWRDERNC